MRKLSILLISSLCASSALASVTVGIGESQKPAQNFTVNDFYGQPQQGHTAQYYQNQIQKSNQATIKSFTQHPEPKIVAEIKQRQQQRENEKFQAMLQKAEDGKAKKKTPDFQVQQQTIQAQPAYTPPPAATVQPAQQQTVEQTQNTSDNVTNFSSASQATAGTGGSQGLGIQY